jgi:hypothetical protein
LFGTWVPSSQRWTIQWYRVINSIMARRQLLSLRERALASGSCRGAQRQRETGARDQYQLYEVIYASGERAGVPDQEHPSRWRERARADGVLGAERPEKRTGSGATGA